MGFPHFFINRPIFAVVLAVLIVLAGVIATQVFSLPWRADWGLVVGGGGLGVLAAVSAGMFATRRVLDAPPSVTLRESQG